MVRWMMSTTALMLVSGIALAAEDATQRAERCASVADSLERLVCYDRIFAPAGAGAAAGPGAAAMPAAPAAAPATARMPAPIPAPARTSAPAPAATADRAASDFGSDQLRRSSAGDEEEAEPRTLTATVKELRETRRNVFRITLDNDQIWQQMDMDSLFHVQVGDTVEINRGRLGGYRMARKSRGGSGWVRVNRLK